MKKLTSHYLVLFLICISCNQTKIQPVLTQAENLMETKPDSSLLLLESIEHPKKMSKLDYATWCLLITQARDKNYVEHTSDSIINVAVNYFEQKNIPSRKAWSYFYLGRIQSDLGETDKAIKSYLKANTYAENLTDNRLKARIYGNIGLLYWEHSMYDKALGMYNEAYVYYVADKDTSGILYALKKTGNIYEALNEPDTAIHIYMNALKMSEQANDENGKASLFKALGNSYETKKEHSIALHYLRKSLDCTHNPEALPSLYFSFASVWIAISQPDSAFYYVQKAMEVDDLSILCSGNRLLYQVYTQKEDLKKAYKANERYLELRDSIETIYKPVEIAKMNALYKKEILENEKKQILLKKKEQNIILLLILLISYAFGSFFIYKYYSRLKLQQLRLQESEQDLIQKDKLLQANSHTINNQNKLLNSLQIEIDKKQRELEKADIHIQKLRDTNENVSSQLLLELHETKNEINNLIDEKRQLQNCQTETYNSRIVLLEEKKQIQTKNKQLADQNKTFEAEIRNLILLKEAIQTEKKQLEHSQRELLNSINEQKKSLYRLLDIAEKWKEEHIHQNVFLNQLKQKEAFTFEKKDWPNFNQNFKKEFPSFIINMKKEFPLMSDSDLRLCCLFKMNLKVAQIATIMGMNPNTISKRKNEISTTYFQVPGAKLIEKLLSYW